jgi:carbamoyltransferase
MAEHQDNPRVDRRHHVQSLLMRESLLDKQVMASTETPVVRMLPDCHVIKVGGRSILASPQSPFVLENLNRYLKRREPWRGYALSGDAGFVAEHFQGPSKARFMECDFRPLDASTFRHVLPHPQAALRIQTVDETAPARFRQLLRAFGQASGAPILVNTSFNGFQEPLVCSPRDAIRVFFGTGLDLLVLGPFVLRK